MLASYSTVFDRDGYLGGAWLEGKKEGNVVTPPYFLLDDDASAFIRACYHHGWVLADFDWSAYAGTAEARVLSTDRAALDRATEKQIAQLLTILIRQDHFVDGAFAAAVRNGFVRAIVRRLNQFADAHRSVRNATQITEVINRNTFVSLALADGFNAFLPVFDGGVDFILYREKDNTFRKVQLKARWTIDRKYVNRDIWIAFPIVFPSKVAWYLMPHDLMLEHAKADGKTKTDSWVLHGTYHMPQPSQTMVLSCEDFRFKPVVAITDAAAEQAAD